MRILILSSEFPPGPGGIGTHAYELASGLKCLGEEILVLSPQDYASKDAITAFNNTLDFRIQVLNQKRIPVLKGVARFWRLLTAMVRWRPDILIASGERSAWLVAVLTLLSPKPWLAVFHGSEYCSRSKLEKRLTTWSFRKAYLCIAVSEFTRQVMVKNGIPADIIRVVSNGANPDEVQGVSPDSVQKFRELHGLSPAQKTLLTVGNLTWRKGQDIVIRSLPGVAGSGWDAHYFMVGLPTLQTEFTELAITCGVLDRVHFLGSLGRRQVLEAYQACDIFIMTSRGTDDGDYEGYGIAAVEAALFGKPAIVSRSGGLPEAVLDGVTGIVVDEEDPEATARGIITLLEDPGMAERLGRMGRQRALTEGTWRHRVAEYHHILTSIVNP